MKAIEKKDIIGEPLRRAETVDSWTQFTRSGGFGSSATKLAEILEAGRYVEVGDRKFQGTPVVLLRKSDYEKLLINSRTSFRIKKLLAALSQAIVSFKRHSVGHESETEFKTIETTLSLGLELTNDLQPLYSSREEYLSANSDASSEEDDFELPSSKSQLKDGISAK